MICDLSRIEFEIIYKRLGVTLEEYGESFYNKMIAPLIEDLEKKGFVTED
jgi:arginyl-tRNA synthetase